MDCREERLPHQSAALGAGLSGSQSVDRALGLLSLIGREPAEGLPLGEIVAGSGLNKPTTRRLLMALMRAGLVEQEPQTRRYCLGEEAFVLGVLAARRHGLLEMAMDSLRRLARETQDTSFLTVRRETYAICLHREEGTYPVRTHALQGGDQHPLGVGAGSLAILAALPDGDVDRIVAASARVSSRVEEIAAASGEQANGIDEMSQTVSHMDEMTQQNAALAEESAASARTLLDQIEQLNRLVSAFRTEAATGSADRRRAA